MAISPSFFNLFPYSFGMHTEKSVSCGVILTDGTKFLIGHATGQPHWDIPKGMLEGMEQPRDAAARELHEETGIELPPQDLLDLGRYAYRPEKDLHLFVYCGSHLPPLNKMTCSTFVTLPNRAPFPEMDRYQYIPFTEKQQYLAFNMNRVITEVEDQIHTICGPQ
jgi:8-oxo-dGTP pyrophosphatase MutT (NUDIX family)